MANDAVSSTAPGMEKMAKSQAFGMKYWTGVNAAAGRTMRPMSRSAFDGSRRYSRS